MKIIVLSYQKQPSLSRHQFSYIPLSKVQVDEIEQESWSPYGHNIVIVTILSLRCHSHHTYSLIFSHVISSPPANIPQLPPEVWVDEVEDKVHARVYRDNHLLHQR